MSDTFQMFCAANKLGRLTDAFRWWLTSNDYKPDQMGQPELEDALLNFGNELRQRYLWRLPKEETQ